MLYRIHLDWAGFELTTLVVIGTECIDSYKSNYHTITSLHDPLHCHCHTDIKLAQIKLKKKYHTVGTVPKSNIKIIERGKIDTPNTLMHDH